MNDTTITLCGWVGSDVTLHEVGEDNRVAVFRVGSTPRHYRDGQWVDQPTAWYTVKAWRQLGRHVADSVRRGEPVIVTGRLVVETWDKGNGEIGTKHVVVARAVGHDLSRGVGRFRRAERSGVGEAGEIDETVDAAPTVSDEDGSGLAGAA